MIRKLTLTLAILAVLVSFSACGRKKTEKLKEKTIKVSVASMTVRNFQYKIPVQGTVEAVDSATISAKTNGTVDEMPVTDGTRLKKGDVLFIIDQKTLKDRVLVSEKDLAVSKTELETAKIEHTLAKVRLHKAESDHKRAGRLFGSKAISQDNMETVEVALEAARASVQKAKANMDYRTAKVEQQESNLAIARKNLEDSVVRSEFNGVVTTTYIDRGEYVQQGTKILDIEDQSVLQVVCYLSSIYYNYVRPGATKVILSLDGKTMENAVITYRAPSIDPISRTFKIKIRLKRGTRLVSGSLCDMTVILQERTGSGIPDAAVLLRDNGRYVAFIAGKDNRAEEVDIRKGIIDGKDVEILNAAKLKNARFIVSGQTFVNRGDLLDILEEKGKKSPSAPKKAAK